MWWKDPQPRSVARTARRSTVPSAPPRAGAPPQAANTAPSPASPSGGATESYRAPQDLFGNLGGEPIPASILQLNQQLRREPTISRPPPAVPQSRSDSRRLSRTALKQIADQRRSMRTDIGRLENAIRNLADDCLAARRDGMHLRVAAQQSQSHHDDAQREIARLQDCLSRERTDADFTLAQARLDHTLESQGWLIAEQRWRDETESMGKRLKTLAEQLARVRAERAQLLGLLRDERSRRRFDRRALDQKHERDIRVEQTQVARLTRELQDANTQRDRVANQHWRGIERIVRQSRWARSSRCEQQTVVSVAIPPQPEITSPHWRLIERIVRQSRHDRALRCIAQRFRANQQEWQTATDSDPLPSADQAAVNQTAGHQAAAQQAAAQLAVATEALIAERFRRGMADQLARAGHRQSVVQASIGRRFRFVAPINPEAEAAPITEPVADSELASQSEQVSEPEVADIPAPWEALNDALDQVASIAPWDHAAPVIETERVPPSVAEPAEDDQDTELDANLTHANDFAEALGQRLLESEKSRRQLRQELAADIAELENLRNDHQSLREDHLRLEDRLRRRNRQLARRQDREREWSARHDDQVADLMNRMELMIQELAIAASQPPVPAPESNADSETEWAKLQRRIDQQDSELLRFERHVKILRELIRQGRTRAKTTIARYERQVAGLEAAAMRRRAA